jgi:hypothetical protein
MNVSQYTIQIDLGVIGYQKMRWLKMGDVVNGFLVQNKQA